MRTLFLHNPLFRLVYPALFGCLVYVLALLIFGSTHQLDENFFSREALLCIGLAYLLSEALRLTVLLLDRLFPVSRHLPLRMLLQTGAGLLCTVAVIWTGVAGYFRLVVGYSEYSRELLVLCSIFGVSSLLYNLVCYGILLLNRHSEERLRQEEALRQRTAHQLAALRRDVNPELLFSSLESLISLVHHDAQAADDYLDQLAALYRYSLETRHQDLGPVQAELRALRRLLHLRQQQHQGQITFVLHQELPAEADAQLLPGSLLRLTDRIIGTSIINALQPLVLECRHTEQFVSISFRPNERLQQAEPLAVLVADVQRAYRFFTPHPVTLHQLPDRTELRLPLLTLQTAGQPSPVAATSTAT